VLKPGHEIGSWIVDRPIGEGGMGQVYRCRHSSDSRSVAAVKLLQPHGMEEGPLRFQREAEALMSLEHPSIVKVWGFGEDKERSLLWLAMELIEGHTLEKYLRRVGRRPSRVARLIHDAADALAHAHSRGIVHRDVKPANLMVDASERLVIVDFGLAYDAEWTQVTGSGLVPGTLSYLPPEVFSQGEATPETCDIYALGQVAYEALSGTRAFDASTRLPLPQRMSQIVAAKNGAETLDPGPDVGEGLRAAIRAATQADPAWRTASMADLRDALAAVVAPDEVALSSEPEALPSPMEGLMPPEPEAPPPPTSPRRAEAGRLAMVAAAALIAGGVGASYLYEPSAEVPGVPVAEETYPGQPPPRSPGTDRGEVPTAPQPSGTTRAAATRSGGAAGPTSEALPVGGGTQSVDLQGPAGAKVYVGDVLLGRLPVTTTLLRGTFTFRVEHEGRTTRVRRTVDGRGLTGPQSILLVDP